MESTTRRQEERRKYHYFKIGGKTFRSELSAALCITAAQLGIYNIPMVEIKKGNPKNTPHT